MISKKEAGKTVLSLELKVKRQKQNMNAIQGQVNKFTDQIANMVKMIVGRDFPDRKQWIIYPEDGWACESKKNPFVLCVYDEGKDSALDHCLFCGEPYERK